jgi:prepilin-type processing-associated H-X9-DG protein
MSNMRQWGIAFQMYADGNKGVMPGDNDNDGDAPFNAFDYWDAPWIWFNAMPPLVGAKPYTEQQAMHLSGAISLPIEGANSLFVCPSTDQAITSDPVGLDGSYFKNWGNTLYPPALTADGARPSFMCYVYNSKLINNTKPHKIVQCRPGAEFVLMVEKRMIPGELAVTDANYNRSLNYLKADRKRFSARHRKGGYLLFADGHVAWFPNVEMQIGRPETDAIGPYTTYNQPGKVIWAARNRDAN